MNKLAIITIAFALFLYTISPTALFRAAAQQASASQETIQAGHTQDVIEVRWSPDDERLISYSAGDDYIRLWEVKSARMLWSARTSFIQQKDEHLRSWEINHRPGLQSARKPARILQYGRDDESLGREERRAFAYDWRR